MVCDFWLTLFNLTLETFSNHKTIFWLILISLFASFMICFKWSKRLFQYAAAAKSNTKPRELSCKSGRAFRA